ncbi:hypothetical protein [Dyadobacter sandarakinus]|uniref:Lipopolysaccharide biosynthesis protein n=1 Tax=Dyadobacter sandarakinus TaxID=2747268 RepID=A0ABX7IBU0_9BACT|nr:hypothetical protein [Dyadobacter sandarakinus]QRR03404.1 hypothetical protein HWI92_22070 [Dyadobacter sandarakinus]
MTTLPTEDARAKSGSNVLEVGFADIILFVRRYIRLFFIIAVVSGILGFGLSFFVTKMFESRIVVLPEYGTSRRSSFAFLAAGLNSDGAEKLLPELYPTILQSSPFGAFVLKQPVKDQQNHSYPSLEAFLNRNAKEKSPGFLSRIFSGSKKEAPKAFNRLSYTDVLSYSPEEQSNIARAISLFNSTVDQKTGIIQISAETEDPFVSAIIVEIAKRYLMQYVEDYRTTKETQNVKMLNERVREAKKRLGNAELALQSYRDRNRNTFSNVARIEEQRLQAEYVLSESLYSSLVQKFEQAKISVKDEKPVFKVLEPAKVPLAKSSPKRFRYGAITAIVSVFITLIYVLIKKERIIDHLTGTYRQQD